MVRAMRPTDALAMSIAQNRKGHELTAVTWPKVPPEGRHPTLLRLLSAFATAYAGDRRIGVAQNDGRVSGVVISRSRATGIVWDVEHLIAPNVATAVELLNWTCD